MKDDMSSAFQSAEFKQLLAKYESMLSNKKNVYFEADELKLIAEYYASIGSTGASDEAISYALNLHPDNLDILIFKCHSLIINDKIEDAQLLIDSLPDQQDYEVRLLQAEICLAEPRFADAKQILKELYLESRDIDTMLDIAQLYLDNHDMKSAKEWIDKAYKQEPNSSEVLNMKALLCFSNGELSKAAKLYNRLLDDYPYSIEYWQNLVKCYLYTNKFEKAQDALEFAMSIDDENLINWELKGNYYLLQNDLEEALSCFKYAEQHAKEKSYIKMILLKVYFLMQNHIEVVEYASILIDEYKLQDYEMADVYHMRAFAYLALKQDKDAMKDVISGLSYNNHYSLLYVVKGEIHLYNLETSLGIEAFKYAEKYADDVIDILRLIAMACLRTNYVEEALSYFQQYGEQATGEEKYANYYFIALCYYWLNEEHEMFVNLVKAAIYSPSTLFQERMMLPKSLHDEKFHQICLFILDQLKSGEIDPYLYM